jgi:alanyl-tRNA synthetase
MMLFGEKYGDKVRMIAFDPSYSTELCGGCHVPRTGNIGFFKIVSESAVAAGIRRVEALTGEAAEAYMRSRHQELKEIQEMLKAPVALRKAVTDLQEELKQLRKENERMQLQQLAAMRQEIWNGRLTYGDTWLVIKELKGVDSKNLKNLAYEFASHGGSYAVVLGAADGDKPGIAILLSEDLVKRGLHAGNLVREAAAHIKGGGGGQPFFATAGGSEASGMTAALEQVQGVITEKLA